MSGVDECRQSGVKTGHQQASVIFVVNTLRRSDLWFVPTGLEDDSMFGQFPPFSNSLPTCNHNNNRQRGRPESALLTHLSVGSNVVELHDVPSPTKVVHRLSTGHCCASP